MVFVGGNHDRWKRLTRLVFDIEAVLARNLQAHHGLGLNECRALKHLDSAKDSELRMRDLAPLLGLKQNSVSRLIDKLETMGLTVRDICPIDKRGVYTIMTQKDREQFQVAFLNYEKDL